MLAERISAIYAFRECEIDLARRELRVLGLPAPIGARAFEIIQILVEASGELVTKDALMNQVWPGAIVNDNALQVHISAVRRALGTNRGMLKTESGRGYRLLGSWAAQSRPAAPAPQIIPFPQIPKAEGLATNLPMAVTPLVGRSATVPLLCDLVSAYRIVTLTGPGGIGKTALALPVARALVDQFSDGGWLVELASLAEPELVPSAIASVLDLKLVGSTVSSEAVARAIGRRSLLLVLDNCEHVIDAVAELVETLVRLCPQVTMLTTSREVLRIEGEYVYRVAPLDVPAQDAAPDILAAGAVELFLARAKALDADYSPNPDELPLVAAVCRHLDGIPLAIEFAAARTATLGLQRVASGLNDRFALLAGGRRTALPRHRTLRAALDWSYDLLAEDERLLLRHLAVFSAGFSIDPVAAVTRGIGLDGSAAVAGLAGLIEKSLVALDASETGSRWRLLETIRAYALEKLLEHGEAEDAARRHATYFRDFFVSRVGDFSARVPSQDLARYSREVDNVRAALDWAFSSSGDAAIGLELTAAYVPVWMNLSLVAECRERCERALARLQAERISDVRLRMQLQIGLGNGLLHTLGPSEQAQTVLAEALEAADALDDLDAQLRVLLILSSVSTYRGEYARATAAVARAAEIARRISDTTSVMVADRRMGITFLTIGRLAEARRCFERVIAFPASHLDEDRRPIWRHWGDRGMSRAMLARVLWLQGFPERAHREAEASIDDVRGPDPQLTMCRVLYFGMGRIAPMTGDFQAAETAISSIIEAAASANAPFWMTAGQFLRGKLLVERGEFAEGLAVLRDAFDICSRTGWRLSYPEFMGSVAIAHAGLGQLDEAHAAVAQAIDAAGGREDGQQWYVPELLRIKGEILLQRNPDRALSAAEACFDQAAALAREQGALSWELRIALSRARLRLAQARSDEAKQALAAVYDRFTEGFETAGLQIARATLDTSAS